ncbi:hypothetical protein ACIQAC_02330 [Streptomyces sp. NPDC088387]|uniref:SCO2583/SCO2584 N-terminal domain-containing protein n=1 Tax=Streptomyces sp. NPDC088387 TaxID=3365859 RepID=UPI0037F3BA08
MGESGQDDHEREYDLKWADNASHKEPSARARMLAARWKENPPGPVPFRPEPDGRRGPVRRRIRRSRVRGPRSRSPWVSTVVILGLVFGVIVLLGYLNVRSPY